MSLTPEQRAQIIDDVQHGIAQGTCELGAAVRHLRVTVANLQQAQFARMCKVSLRTLIQIEQGEGNPTLKSLNAVFRPFGLQMGVVRRQRQVI
ncbi:helix-turn-helix domain-containing protein [Pseudomonas sp. S31]|uniref:helix-turn-helix domain-containing protein n=1 Tax=Pseudomonas sp. S31 TaxID=1564473 RepID=UPI001914AD60|nr:helix-turn-helix transcriptional regulator [Pseudomonas sp. S31]MBK4998317.1 helix-turn-helix domain-containing protein [Pseudomonas sp. S31]